MNMLKFKIWGLSSVANFAQHAVKWFLFFTVLSILLEITGQLILFFISDIEIRFSAYIGKNLFIQCCLFLLITLLTMKWIKKKHYYLVFPLIMFLLLNSVFLFTSELVDNKLKFATSFPSFSSNCYYYNANIVTDFLNIYNIIPLEGVFGESHFFPHNMVYFYILFAVTPFVYYTVLTCLCSYFVKKIWQR